MPSSIKSAVLLKLLPAINKRYDLTGKNGLNLVDQDKLEILLANTNAYLDKLEPAELVFQVIKAISECTVSPRKAFVIIQLSKVIRFFMRTTSSFNPLNIGGAYIIEKIAYYIEGGAAKEGEAKLEKDLDQIEKIDKDVAGTSNLNYTNDIPSEEEVNKDNESYFTKFKNYLKLYFGNSNNTEFNDDIQSKEEALKSKMEGINKQKDTL